MRYSLYVVLASTLIGLGCTAPTTESPSKSTTVTKRTGRPEDSFEVTLPTGPNWQILQRGPLGDDSDTFVVAVADAARSFQLTVMVLPSLDDAPTLESMKAGWEKGFLKKATRKKSSEDITIGGQPAYRLTAALDGADGTSHEVVGILIVAEGWNFTIAITKSGENILDDPEVRQFVESFKIVAKRP